MCIGSVTHGNGCDETQRVEQQQHFSLGLGQVYKVSICYSYNNC